MHAPTTVQFNEGAVELPPTHPAGETPVCAAGQVPVEEPEDVGVHVPPQVVVDHVYTQAGADRFAEQ